MQLILEKRAIKELDKIPTPLVKTILEKIELLANESKTNQAKRLRNSPLYRLRVGDYRIIYYPDYRKNLLIVLKIAHRSKVY